MLSCHITAMRITSCGRAIALGVTDVLILRSIRTSVATNTSGMQNSEGRLHAARKLSGRTGSQTSYRSALELTVLRMVHFWSGVGRERLPLVITYTCLISFLGQGGIRKLSAQTFKTGHFLPLCRSCLSRSPSTPRILTSASASSSIRFCPWQVIGGFHRCSYGLPHSPPLNAEETNGCLWNRRQCRVTNTPPIRGAHHQPQHCIR